MHTLLGEPTHLSCGGRCRDLNHFGQKVLGKWKLGQSSNSTVIICHFKGTPPKRTNSLGEKVCCLPRPLSLGPQGWDTVLVDRKAGAGGDGQE